MLTKERAAAAKLVGQMMRDPQCPLSGRLPEGTPVHVRLTSDSTLQALRQALIHGTGTSALCVVNLADEQVTTLLVNPPPGSPTWLVPPDMMDLPLERILVADPSDDSAGELSKYLQPA